MNRKAVAAILSVCAGALSAVAADALFRGGLWKQFDYDRPSTLPVVFGGESRSADAKAPDYCIYLDIWYDDGTPVWGRRADWSSGTHGWEKTVGAFVPEKPVRRIQMFAFLRRGTGTAEFRNLWLERREGAGEILSLARRTGRPYADGDQLTLDIFHGRTVTHRTVDLPGGSSCPPETCPVDGVCVWTADSMRKITPLTFPSEGESAKRAVDLDVARDERESAQINISAGKDGGWSAASLVLPTLKTAAGVPLKGELVWQRVGYVAREPGYYTHPEGVSEVERWLPDPLLPAAPMRVRAASTQGAWVTVHPARDAAPGVYSGDVVVTERGDARARVRLTVRVRAFAQPETFGMPTAFCVMDGFTRARYGARYETMRRASWDVMLDHRLNPDDISRTEPPPIADLLRARARGMNRFNILNIVPEPKGPEKPLWVCYAPPEAIFNPAFYPAFKARLEPYVAELRRHGLEKFAYLYGFDERQKKYYAGIDGIWRRLKRDFPDIPVMTTAMMYRDMAEGRTNVAHTLTTDWYCPLTSVYRPELSAELRMQGKQVWWYTCCGPTYPYANMASLEYPPIEGRLLGWMTHLYRADGLLFWHVNFWERNSVLDETDTFFPDWHTYSGLHMPGDGIFLYPGKDHVLPSIRLAQVRDGVEDYERLQLAAAAAGAEKADAVSRTLITSMKEYTRDPAKLRAARDRLGDLIEGK